MVLLEDAEALLLGHYHLTRGRLKVSAEYAEKCGLACAVCADDTIAVAVCEFKVYVFEKRRAAELDADIADCYHSTSVSSDKTEIKPSRSERALVLYL